MIENKILFSFLESGSKRALKEVEETGNLSEKNAIPLLLKGMFERITHLEKEMVTKTEFKEAVSLQFKLLGFGFSVIGIMLTIATIFLAQR